MGRPGNETEANVSVNASVIEGVGNGTEEVELQAQWRPAQRIMTLYHTTSPEVAEKILREGFKPGRNGWCGGAIYFIDQPYLKKTKFATTTKTGAIIEAKVDMGRMARMDKRCTAGFGWGIWGAKKLGYESLEFNPGDGNEYVIWSNSRVISTRRFK